MPPDRPDDTGTLVASAKLGDQNAWNELYRRYRPQLSVVISPRIPDLVRQSLDTSDVLQSGMLSAFKGLTEFEYHDEYRFRAWLVRVCANKLRDRIRAGLRMRRLDKPIADGSSVPTDRIESDTIDLPDENTPSEIVDRAERQAELLDRISRLANDDQDLIWMRLFDDSPWGQIAQRFGRSESALRKRYQELANELVRPRL